MGLLEVVPKLKSMGPHVTGASVIFEPDHAHLTYKDGTKFDTVNTVNCTILS